MLAEAKQVIKFYLQTVCFVVVLIIATGAWASFAYAQSEDAAHALAEKFSAAADRAEKEKAQHEEQQRRRRKEEQDALTKKIEEIEQWVEEERAKIQAAEAEIKARKERAAKDAQETAKRQAYEQELLERAKVEAEERKRQEEVARAAEAAREREAARRAEQERLKLEREAMAAKRDAEAETLAEKLENARKKHSARKVPEPQDVGAGKIATRQTPDGTVEVGVRGAASAPDEDTTRLGIVSRKRAKASERIAKPSGLGAPIAEEINARAALRFQWPPVTDPGREKRVTILIDMDVGKKGIRRWSKTADPMLCIGMSCFLSRGPGKSARKLHRSKAFGPSIALGIRGLACRSSPRCVFRNVDLGGYDADLQPVDLRFLRHDRRQAKPVRADGSCQVIDARLTCDRLIQGKDWRAWIIPESVAKRAGPAVLGAVLKRGLKPAEIVVQRR